MLALMPPARRMPIAAILSAVTTAVMEAIARAALFVDSRQTTIGHIGEIQIPLDNGTIREGDIRADFYDLPSGSYARPDDDAITIAKNGGGAHLDLMTARHILQVAG